jgi:hypothetical protein
MRTALVIWALKLGWAVQASAAQAPLPALPASEPLEQALPAAQPPVTYTAAELDRIVSLIAMGPERAVAAAVSVGPGNDGLRHGMD